MRIKFLGATQNVTGSKFLIESEDFRILVDCGLYQEREFRYRNWEAFPVKPSSIHTILLTHAHIDHCGYLPKLVKEGFKGHIFCTYPTAEISRIALLDSAKLQESDAEFKQKRHHREGRKGTYPEVPLYTTEDAQRVFQHFKKVFYKEEVEITPLIKAKFFDAGHILGASMIELSIRKGNKVSKCIFSGDIGRWDRPILCDPTLFKDADYVFMESTYGNRIHEDKNTCSEKLKRVINETNESGGNIIIPTFAIERAQELLYLIHELLMGNKIPHLMIFLDSPMAIEVTEIFKRHPEYFDKEAQALLHKNPSLFNLPLLKTTHSVRESKAINHIKGTSIILSGSGMCTGGRIKHHLANNITRSESTILFVGYQAAGTLGREILERSSQVRILGENYQVRAKIEQIGGFSAHADKTELLRWISGFTVPPEKIFIVHGEKDASGELALTLRNTIHSEVLIPHYSEEYHL